MSLRAQDEHRLRLLPVVRRIRAPRGRRRYAWLYVYGFVRPRTGQTWWGLLPTVSVEAMSLAPAAFDQDERIGPERRVVLFVDNPGWHTGARLALPEGVHLAFLPAYLPELQPAERPWGLVDEPAANRTFADLGELQDTLAARCLALTASAPPSGSPAASTIDGRAIGARERNSDCPKVV